MKERMITTFEGIILNSKFGKTACVNPLQLAENGDYFYAHVQLAFEVYQAALSANHIGDADKMDDHIPDGGNMVQQKATPCGQVSITETGKHTCETLRIGDEKICPDCSPCRGLLAHLQKHELSSNPLQLPAKEPVKQESKWISVEDRLPEKDVFVDVLLRSRDNPNYEKRVADVSFISGEFKVQTFFDHEYVSHWMPLPLPPVKEVSDGR